MIEIRACTPDDAVAVSTLLGELGYTVSIRHATEHVRGSAKLRRTRFFSRPRTVKSLDFSHYICVGCCNYTNPIVRVTALVVDQRTRHHGAGMLLMEHAERMGSAAGCEFVEVTSAMDRAEAYEPNSFCFRKQLVRQ